MNRLIDLSNSQFSIQVDNVSLNSFRGFGGVSIPLDPKLTVFIANNGGGKTTVLDAIFEGVRSFVQESKLPIPNTGESFLSEKDVKINTQASSLTTSLSLEYFLLEQDEDIDENPIDISVLYQGTAEKVIGLNLAGKIESSQAQVNDDHIFRISEAQTGFVKTRDNLPIVKYFHLGARKGTKSHDAFKWLFTWVDKRQKMAGQTADDSIHRYYLGLVEQAVSDFLSDEEFKYSELKISYSMEEDILALKKISMASHEGDSLDMDQLSSGERALLSIVADIAISLIDANPQTPYDYDPENYSREANTPLKYGTGIVLIDEIDLHLHPRWQRRVVPKLLEIFPNVQFVVTTHSPLVLSSIDRKHGIVLKDGKAEPIPYVRGRDADAVLADAFEVNREAKYQQLLDQFYALLENNKKDAEAILGQLKSDWGEDDEEIIRAQSYLDIY